MALAELTPSASSRRQAARRCIVGLLVGHAAVAQQPTPPPELVRYWVSPHAADSTIARFDEANYVVYQRGVTAAAPLLVFMPGTGGRPAGTTDFADVAARQGYRVIGLEYNSTPAVAQICPRDRDPNCSERFRRKRIYGEDATSVIDDAPTEAIMPRLVKLLTLLQREHPSEGWSDYLNNGQPSWPRIAVSGLSQGAGMAAYIAQHATVARAILFSSPWDEYGPRHTLAPWVMHGPGETPAERWYAAFHAREPTADLIARAYAALHIPRENIRVFAAEPAVDGAYHPSVVGNRPTPRAADGSPVYLNEWRYLLGTP